MAPSQKEREYWRERDRLNALRIYEYAEKQGQMVTRWFSRVAREMDECIKDYVERYMESSGLSYEQAHAELTDPQAIRRLREDYSLLVSLYANDREAAQLLERLNASQQITRQEHLKMQLNLLATEAYGDYEQITTHTLTTLFEESYYKSIFDWQQYKGYGSGFDRLNTNQIIAATSTAWSGKNYSETLWGRHRTSLARHLNRIITTGAITGAHNREKVIQIQQAMGMSAADARRLIRTESTYVASQGNLLSYEQNDVEEYRYMAVLDNDTSEICGNLDGKVYKVKEAQVGVNLAPMHPHCRSTSVPHEPDPEFDGGNTRAARDGAGNTYTVPANMNYKEWYKNHVAANPGEMLAQRKYLNGLRDSRQWATYRQLLGRKAPSSLEDFQNLKYTDTDAWLNLKSEYLKMIRAKK